MLQNSGITRFEYQLPGTYSAHEFTVSRSDGSIPSATVRAFVLGFAKVAHDAMIEAGDDCGLGPGWEVHDINDAIEAGGVGAPECDGESGSS